MPIDSYLVNRAAERYALRVPATLADGRPGLRARSVAHAAYAAVAQHLANISAADTHADPDLAPDLANEMRGALSQRLITQLRGTFENPLNGLIRQAERSVAETDAAAAPYRLKVDPESSTQMIRTDQAWRNSVLPMLESGMGWDQIIPRVDADGLLAIQRFAPARESAVRDRFKQHEVPEVLAGIQRASEQRNIDLAPLEARAALMEHEDAVAALEYTRAAASLAYTTRDDGTVSRANERDTAGASIALKRSTFQVGAQNPVDTSPEALAAYEGALSATSAA